MLQSYISAKRPAGDRDGVLYLFELEDIKANRAARLVQLFRSGQDKIMRPNHDAVIDSVGINRIRRAFDSGALNFDAKYKGASISGDRHSFC